MTGTYKEPAKSIDKTRKLMSSESHILYCRILFYANNQFVKCIIPFFFADRLHETTPSIRRSLSRRGRRNGQRGVQQFANRPEPIAIPSAKAGVV